MSLWRLEMMRMVRTRRWIAPAAIYLGFGILGPFTARYMAQMISSLGGLEVVVPEATAADGFSQYVANASQLGLLAVVVVAAGALAVDKPAEMGIFLRTRVRRAADLVVPRVVTVTALMIVVWALGAAIAWVTVLFLFESVSPASVAIGTALGSLHLVFVVALVAWFASSGRATLVTVMAALGVLVTMPALALIPVLEKWVPSELVGALDGLVRGLPASDFLPAAAVTSGLAVALLAGAIRRIDRREV